MILPQLWLKLICFMAARISTLAAADSHPLLWCWEMRIIFLSFEALNWKHMSEILPTHHVVLTPSGIFIHYTQAWTNSPNELRSEHETLPHCSIQWLQLSMTISPRTWHTWPPTQESWTWICQNFIEHAWILNFHVVLLMVWPCSSSNIMQFHSRLNLLNHKMDLANSSNINLQLRASQAHGSCPQPTQTPRCFFRSSCFGKTAHKTFSRDGRSAMMRIVQSDCSRRLHKGNEHFPSAGPSLAPLQLVTAEIWEWATKV